MINLLPPETKKDRYYGRKNVVLLKWISLSLVLFIMLIASIGIGLGIMNRAISNANINKQVLATSISDDKLNETEQSYNEFLNNVKTVTQILSKQVLYSSLLQQIGKVTPPGANLNSVSISSTDNALNLNFTINSPDIAPILQLNLQDQKNKLFERADIIQVNCQQKEKTDNPCTAQLRAEYKKDAMFIFINTVGGNK